MIIYKITNIINSKIYIGCTTTNMNKRFKEHAAGRRSYVSKSIRKYGKENFILELIEEVNTREEMFEREIYWINYYNSFINGMNLTKGGDGGLGLCGEKSPRFGKKKMINYQSLIEIEKEVNFLKNILQK